MDLSKKLGNSVDFSFFTSLSEFYRYSTFEAMFLKITYIYHELSNPTRILGREVDELLVQEVCARTFANSIALIYADCFINIALKKQLKKMRTEICYSSYLSRAISAASLQYEKLLGDI